MIDTSMTTANATLRGKTLRAPAWIRSRSSLLLGAAIVLAAIVLVLPVWLPDPLAMSRGEALRPPSLEHLFGTDQFGRDVLSRVVSGAKLSWLVGALTVVMSLLLGGVYGAISAFSSPRVDNAMMRVLEVNLAFPAVLLAVVLATAIGPGLSTVLIVMAVVYFGPVARFVRGLVQTQIHLEYIDSAFLMGARRARLLFRHVLPNIALPLMVFMTTVAAESILLEAGLSFIGAGIAPPEPAWGSIVNEGKDLIIVGTWWVSFFGGLGVILTVMILNWLADAILDDYRIGGNLA